jgi:hypothetical protein
MGGGGGGLYRRGGASGLTNLDVINDFDERQSLCLRFNESGHHVALHLHVPSGLGLARRGERARARVVHRPALTGFTSGVHKAHPLSRSRSFSIPGTELRY